MEAPRAKAKEAEGQTDKSRECWPVAVVEAGGGVMRPEACQAVKVLLRNTQCDGARCLAARVLATM